MTTTDVAVRDGAALAIQPGQEMWTDKQRAALAVLGIKDATNGDLAVFMHGNVNIRFFVIEFPNYFISLFMFANSFPFPVCKYVR